MDIDIDIDRETMIRNPKQVGLLGYRALKLRLVRPSGAEEIA